MTPRCEWCLWERRFLPFPPEALINSPEIDLVGVLTQPDRPSGRGQKLVASPVKQLAEQHGLTVLQPERLRKDEAVQAWLAEQKADFFVTAAFGQILPQTVLDMPKYGTVNVHASLLPKYRGANPIQWAILNGDAETGVTTMMTVLEVDAGDMLMRAIAPIDENDTMPDVLGKMAQAGGEIIVPSLTGLASGSIVPEPQDASQSTHAPKLTKDDATIDWSQPAQVIHNKIRAQQPWPGTETQMNGSIGKIALKVHQSRLCPEQSDTVLAPGSIANITPEGLLVQTGEGMLLITQVQAAGKPKVSARDWANGALNKPEKDQAHIFETCLSHSSH